MSEDLKCPICGKPTAHSFGNYNRYGLCIEHSAQQKKGEIVQCKDCGKWNKKGTVCTCQNPWNKNNKMNSHFKTNEEDLKQNNEFDCIICGKPSNGKHLCKSCYYKYKNKGILLKIHNCEFPTGEPLDESYEGIYECDDGHIVKSFAEQTIDDYLYDKGIFHGYEIPLDIGEGKQPLKPDFCLKDYLGKGKNVYIEYFGLKGNKEYDETTSYKINFYRKLGITLICMYPKTDSKNLKFALQTKLRKQSIKENQINYFEE